MRKLLVQPQARLDLLEIWHHIAQDSIQNANQMNERLEQGIRGLIVMPGKGHVRKDVKDPKYRFWTVRPYVIAYRYDERTLRVVRVIHGARNFRALFRR